MSLITDEWNYLHRKHTYTHNAYMHTHTYICAHMHARINCRVLQRITKRPVQPSTSDIHSVEKHRSTYKHVKEGLPSFTSHFCVHAATPGGRNTINTRTRVGSRYCLASILIMKQQDLVSSRGLEEEPLGHGKQEKIITKADCIILTEADPGNF